MWMDQQTYGSGVPQQGVTPTPPANPASSHGFWDRSPQPNDTPNDFVGICSAYATSDDSTDAASMSTSMPPQMPTLMLLPQMSWGYPPMVSSQMS